jgi:hypothetical protein
MRVEGEAQVFQNSSASTVIRTVVGFGLVGLGAVALMASVWPDRKPSNRAAGPKDKLSSGHRAGLALFGGAMGFMGIFLAGMALLFPSKLHVTVYRDRVAMASTYSQTGGKEVVIPFANLSSVELRQEPNVVGNKLRSYLVFTHKNGRVTKQDLLTHYEATLTPAGAGGSGIPPIPEVDFSQFGPTRTVPLSMNKNLPRPHLPPDWLNVPHVTHADEADITDLDAWRRELDEAAKPEGYRVTLLAFLLKAAASALRTYPEVNSSLAGDSLVLKDYVNIGVAVDTPDGLVVPVVREVDRRGIGEISRELGDLSARARDGKLSGTDMQGASFTISSLGGIGGTHFTPIVNAPEVAILGVVRSKMAPVWDGEAFVPRLMLPLCLSYDHRVIDGALAARFTAHLGHLLTDVRRLAL